MPYIISKVTLYLVANSFRFTKLVEYIGDTYYMKRPFYETELIFGLNPLILDIFSKNKLKINKIGPFTSKMGQNWVKLAKNVQSCVFSEHFGYFRRKRIFVGSAACHF